MARTVSGLYRGESGAVRLDLRVDVDGGRPLSCVSGDLYDVSGATVTYFGSFVVTSPTIKKTRAQFTISGLGTFSFANNSTPFVTVTIKRVAAARPPASAKVVLSSAAGADGTTYTCEFVSPAFRTVQWEQDSIKGTTPFESYDVASLASPGPNRTLTVKKAFDEAGIEVEVTGVSNIFDMPEEVGETWSNAELHASMLEQFSLWEAGDPQWRMWLLVATKHEVDGVRGAMFDQAKRQGCAVFHTLVGGEEAETQRAALRTYVHELGHCFNLLHSWSKHLAVPPAKSRPDALSWMNYVDHYPDGPAAYWAAFPFQFDDHELIHLRHGFRNNVIMGGSDFKTGAADVDELMLSRPVVDESGLALRLEAQPTFRLSQPVVVELKLSTDVPGGKSVRPEIHPNYGFVRVAIRKPGGAVTMFRPLIEQCVDRGLQTLMPDDPIYTSAYIGYGKGGFVFTQPGFYDLRAIYQAPDGSDVVSNVVTVRVGSPRSDADEEIADAYFGDAQGTLFYLLGSDSPRLAGGNNELEKVIEKHPEHPLTAYARLAKGINESREFKTVTNEKKVHCRAKKPRESAVRLRKIAEQPQVLDNVTLNMMMRRLARAQAEAGEPEAATATLHDMIAHFAKKNLRAPVLDRIAKQARRTAEELSLPL